MQQTPTSKDKIITIVRAIIESGRTTGRTNVKSFYATLAEPNFDKTINTKIQIFQNVPEDSKFFSIIYSTAKNCLADLKKNIINIHATELIKIFYTLDDNFRKNLVSKEFNEKSEKTFCEQIKENPKPVKENEIIELPEGVTGIQFLTAKVMDEKSIKELGEALNNL